ncbi:MAG: hypothetical protein AAF353_00815 [Pseudomonadota bacterium]
MKHIGFWDHGLKLTGTTTALYDYAHFNETILGNRSYVFYENGNHRNHRSIIDRFNNRFLTYGVDHFDETDDLIARHGITHLYIIKSGQDLERQSRVAKNCIHCVFQCGNPHGDVYAAVSPYIADYNGTVPVVPHIVHLPESNDSMRAELGIPDNAVVFGGYGGRHAFDIDYVKETVHEVAAKHDHIHFLFANFEPFGQPRRNVHFLPAVVSNQKAPFINTCDAMLWARQMGETFGLAIAEFSLLNKPVFACKIGYQAHVKLLGDNAIWYTRETLFDQLVRFDPQAAREKDWNNYRSYSPQRVMKKFDRVFLS